MVQAVSSAETTNKKHLSTVKKGAVIGAIAGGITQTAGNLCVNKYVPEVIETAKEMLESYGFDASDTKDFAKILKSGFKVGYVALTIFTAGLSALAGAGIGLIVKTIKNHTANKENTKQQS